MIMENVPENIIIRSLQGTADAEDERKLNDWLKADSRNAVMFAEMREIWTSRNAISDSETALGWQNLQKRIAERQSTPVSRLTSPEPNDKQPHIPRWISYAAAILIGAVVASTAWLVIQPRTIQEKLVVRNEIYNNGGFRQVELPDSSLVWLNGKGKLTYNEGFDADGRTVALEGQAYFEVEKDAARPFVVKMNELQIQVKGTSFDVRHDDDNHTLITLVTGKLSISSLDAKGQLAATTQLDAGQQAVYDPQTQTIAVTSVETDYYALWKDGTYRFAEEPFANIARQMEYHFGVKIKMSKRTAARRFTGLITPDHSVSDVLDILRKSSAVKYRIANSTVIISE